MLTSEAEASLKRLIDLREKAEAAWERYIEADRAKYCHFAEWERLDDLIRELKTDAPAR